MHRLKNYYIITGAIDTTAKETFDLLNVGMYNEYYPAYYEIMNAVINRMCSFYIVSYADSMLWLRIFFFCR